MISIDSRNPNPIKYDLELLNSLTTISYWYIGYLQTFIDKFIEWIKLEL